MGAEVVFRHDHKAFSRLTLGAAALLLFGGTTAAGAEDGPTIKKLKETGVIVIGHRDTSLPISFIDENKQPIGYAIDLCKSVVGALKTKLKLPKLEIAYLPVTSSTRIPAVKDGKVDLECGTTTNNAERRQEVAFTIPHYYAGARLLTKTGTGVKSLNDLSGKTVVTTKGTTHEKLLRQLSDERGLKLQVVLGKDHADSFQHVADGRATAFLMDDILLYSLRAQSPKPADFEVTREMLTIEPLAIMMRKGDAEFKRIVDIEISRIMVTGEIYKIYQRWFQQPIPPKGVNLDLPMNYLLRDSLKAPTDQVPF